MIYKIEYLKEDFYNWLAWKLPKKLVYYATVRLIAYGTGSNYNKTNVSTVRAITVLKRWEKVI